MILPSRKFPGKQCRWRRSYPRRDDAKGRRFFWSGTTPTACVCGQVRVNYAFFATNVKMS